MRSHGFMPEAEAQRPDPDGPVPGLSSAGSGVEAECLSLSRAGLLVSLLLILAQ